MLSSRYKKFTFINFPFRLFSSQFPYLSRLLISGIQYIIWENNISHGVEIFHSKEEFT